MCEYSSNYDWSTNIPKTPPVNVSFRWHAQESYSAQSTLVIPSNELAKNQEKFLMEQKKSNLTKNPKVRAEIPILNSSKFSFLAVFRSFLVVCGPTNSN